MKIAWVRKYQDADIYEAKTDTKFWVQIAPSTEGGFAWVIFHNDSRFAQWGGDEPSIEECKEISFKWLLENLDTWVVTNPREK